jgi:uncharacterized protein (DUF2267 family)
MHAPQKPRQTPADFPVVGQLLQSGVEALYTLVAAVLLATDDQLSADQAAERAAQLRNEVHHALQDWAPPPDSYRARNLASHD